MHAYTRGTLVSAALIALLLALPVPSRGAELVTFPSAQIQAPQAGSVEARFRDSIQNLSCAELAKLKETLSEKGNASAAAADRNYYARLIGIVSEKVALMTCPAR